MNRSHMLFTFGERNNCRALLNLNLTVPAMHCATAVWPFKHPSFISNCAAGYKTVTCMFGCTHAGF